MTYRVKGGLGPLPIGGPPGPEKAGGKAWPLVFSFLPRSSSSSQTSSTATTTTTRTTTLPVTAKGIQQLQSTATATTHSPSPRGFLSHEAATAAQMMPFDAYLQDVEDSAQRPSSSSASAYNSHAFASNHTSAAVPGASSTSNSEYPGEMKFHLPPFLDDGARLAEGGGGEVFPPSAMASLSAPWYSTNLFPSRPLSNFDPYVLIFTIWIRTGTS
jgi:hypothetical protein